MGCSCIQLMSLKVKQLHLYVIIKPDDKVRFRKMIGTIIIIIIIIEDMFKTISKRKIGFYTTDFISTR